MITARSPIRISLAGGSTDLDSFLKKNETGSVISFSANLYTFISLRRDLLGHNGQSNKFLIDYMKREVVNDYEEIKNDIARVVLKYFDIEPITCWFTSDFYSSGSGLASSSSYMNAFIKAVSVYKKLDMSNYEICKISHKLERKFNPLTGYQDPYGCGLGGFNRLRFSLGKDVLVEPLSQDILDHFDMYLIHTGLSRKSTPVLKSISSEKCVDLLQIVEEMNSAIVKRDSQLLFKMILEGWDLKKKTSNKIAESPQILEMDDVLTRKDFVRAHRLLGAGNGGYFLVFLEKDTSVQDLEYTFKLPISKINVCNDGIAYSEF